MKKRTRAILALCLACAFALTPLWALAADAFDESRVTWLDLQGVTFYEFREGLCMIMVDGKYGYINTDGDIAIPIMYDSAGYFSEGKAVVRKDDAIGFIDSANTFTPVRIPDGMTADNYVKKGNAISSYFFGGYVYLPCKDGDALLRAHNLLLDSTGNRFDTGEEGRYPFGPVKDGVVSTGHATTSVRYIDAATGAVLFDRATAEANNAELLKDYDRITSFYIPDNGLIPFQVQKGDAYTYGFLDKTGHIVLEPVYTQFWGYRFDSEYKLFTDGLMSVADDAGMFGCIDAAGNTVIPFNISGGGLYFSEGIAALSRDGKWGMLDKADKLAIPCIYERIGDCHEGYLFAWLDGKAGLIDMAGNTVIPFIFPAGVSSVYDGTVIVSDAPGHIGVYHLTER